MALRLAFMGTPDFSVPTLRALHEAGHTIAAAYSQPPRAAGRRGLELVPSPVQREAERLGLPVRTPLNLRAEEDRAAFRALELDAAVVVAFGLILPQPVLDAPSLGCLNGHASLLPRWRGAAPIQRAVMAGDTQTGMTVMRMEAGLDTGPAGLRETLAIGADEAAGELHGRLSQLCAGLMVRAIGELEAGTLRFAPQPAEGVTYAAKIDKAEARIDWTLPAAEVHDRIRGLSPFPGAWCPLPGGRDGERLKLLRSTLVSDAAGRPGEVLDELLTIACGTGAVRLLEVQRAGGRPVPAGEFLRGTRLRRGDTVS